MWHQNGQFFCSAYNMQGVHFTQYASAFDEHEAEQEDPVDIPDYFFKEEAAQLLQSLDDLSSTLGVVGMPDKVVMEAQLSAFSDTLKNLMDLNEKRHKISSSTMDESDLSLARLDEINSQLGDLLREKKERLEQICDSMIPLQSAILGMDFSIEDISTESLSTDAFPWLTNMITLFAEILIKTSVLAIGLMGRNLPTSYISESDDVAPTLEVNKREEIKLAMDQIGTLKVLWAKEVCLGSRLGKIITEIVEALNALSAGSAIAELTKTLTQQNATLQELFNRVTPLHATIFEGIDAKEFPMVIEDAWVEFELASLRILTMLGAFMDLQKKVEELCTRLYGMWYSEGSEIYERIIFVRLARKTSDAISVKDAIDVVDVMAKVEFELRRLLKDCWYPMETANFEIQRGNGE